MPTIDIDHFFNQLYVNYLGGIKIFKYDTGKRTDNIYYKKNKKIVMSNPEVFAQLETFKNAVIDFLNGSVTFIEQLVPVAGEEGNIQWCNVSIGKEGQEITCAIFDITDREEKLIALQRENNHLQEKIKLYEELYNGDEKEQEKASQALNKAAKRLIRADKLAIKSGKVMVWFQDNTEFDMVKYFYGNELFISKLGLESAGEGLITRSSYHETLYSDDKEGLVLEQAYLAKVRQIASGEIESLEGVIVKHRNIKTGELIYCEHASEVEERYADGSVKIDGGFLVDVTERVKQDKAIKHLANHDLLTDLYNRNYIETIIKEKKLPTKYMLVIADLDGLKLINDAFGHIKGDYAIKTVALTLKQFYPDDVIARMGGDEFLVLSKVLDETYHEASFKKINEVLQIESTKMNVDISVSLGSHYVDERVVSYDDAFNTAENLMYRRKLGERNSRKSKTLETILDTLNARSVETHEHSMRMAHHAVRTLHNLGHHRTSDAEDISLLARVHDIGKIGIPDSILLKNGPLTVEEFEIIKTHTEAGYKIVKNIINSDLISDGVYYHHERVDGKGYPLGLKGDEIPLFAKVIAVCDVYDVMTSGRIYQQAKSKEEAIAELIRCSDTQFDKDIVKAFIKGL